MNISQVSSVISKTNNAIIRSFETAAERYFTENDIVCAYYEELKKQFDTIAVPVDCNDINGKKNFVIHTEYPTPFRCDMSKGFRRIQASASDKNKFKRGHYDLVIINPDFIKKHTYREINVQDIVDQECIDNGSLKNETAPQLLYAVEFMYKRKPFKASKGKDIYRAADAYYRDIKQDYDKLVEGNATGHIGEFCMIVFIKSNRDDFTQRIHENCIKASMSKLVLVLEP